jgi:hypothetical protein
MLLFDGLQSFWCRRTLVRALKVTDKHGTWLVPVVNSAFGQIDEPRSGRAGQCREQIVGLYLIISSRDLNDRVIHLDEFFTIARVVILVDRSRLEFIRPGNLPECWCHSAEPASL